MLSGEATNANFIVFGLTRSGLEPTIIYRTRGVHANHYTTDGDDTTSRAKYIQDYTDKALSLKVKYI